MNPNYKRWQKLFLACMGLTLGAGFCMKWMEEDLLLQGEKFTIIGLEISYGKQKMMEILAGLDPHVKAILRYLLYFDFAYMLGVFPGIAALCMMAKEKTSVPGVRNILFILALLQMVAWGCDIFENLQLLNWIDNPVIGNDFGTYHIVVWTKWILAIAGIVMALPFVFRRNRNMKKVN